MKTLVRGLVLLLAFAALPVFSQGYTFTTPPGWTLEWSPAKNTSDPPNANFSSGTDLMHATLSIIQGRDAAMLNNEQLQDVVLSMAKENIASSVEGKAVIRPFGAGNSGIFVRLTDRDSKAQLRYASFAIYRKGPTLILGVLFSNDHDSALMPKFFGLIESVVVAAPGSASLTNAPATASKSKAPKVKAPAVKAVVWAAIATDTTKGETDPYYGIGEGDSRVEAEQDAIGLCREEGAKVCVVRIAYTQCGAYAVSANSSGAGTGVTRREAEAKALDACNARRCEIVASDCN